MEISRGALAALVMALVGSLMAVAFLLGRQSAQPLAATSAPTRAAAPMVVAASPAPASLETPQPRPLAIPPLRPQPRTQSPVVVGPSPPAPPARPAPARVEVQVAAAPSPPPARPRPAPARISSTPREPADYPTADGGEAAKPPASTPSRLGDKEKEAIRRYFAQVDAVMAETESLEDPNAFATELLQQSLQGDNSGFESLLKIAQSAVGKMQAIKAPPSCKEHQQLTVAQLKQAVTLLRSVQSAAKTGDTSVLASLSLQGKDMKLDIGRLQKLDNQLRASAR